MNKTGHLQEYRNPRWYSPIGTTKDRVDREAWAEVSAEDEMRETMGRISRANRKLCLEDQGEKKQPGFLLRFFLRKRKGEGNHAG